MPTINRVPARIIFKRAKKHVATIQQWQPSWEICLVKCQKQALSFNKREAKVYCYAFPHVLKRDTCIKHENNYLKKNAKMPWPEPGLSSRSSLPTCLQNVAVVSFKVFHSYQLRLFLDDCVWLPMIWFYLFLINIQSSQLKSHTSLENLFCKILHIISLFCHFKHQFFYHVYRYQWAQPLYTHRHAASFGTTPFKSMGFQLGQPDRPEQSSYR
jgi:hypothetical protein